MIFATVGTQLPFPRLIGALDACAAELGERVVAQAGPRGPGNDGPWPHLEIREQIPPAEFEALFAEARPVVAHAGVGTILSAKRLGKPLVILPRRHALGEHRNDHQLATAQQVAALPGIHVAWQTEDLAPLLAHGDLMPATGCPSPSRAALVARLRTFIAG